MKFSCLSVQNPWAWCLVNRRKPVENRDWKPTNPGLRFRGPCLIHTGKKIDKDAYDSISEIDPEAHRALPLAGNIDRGGIVGILNIIACVQKHPSPWFFGPYAFVCADAEPFPFVPLNGQLGFFGVDVTALGIEDRVRAYLNKEQI